MHAINLSEFLGEMQYVACLGAAKLNSFKRTTFPR